MKVSWKFPGWVPRLTRGQRVLRNLAAAGLALILAWAVCDFPAPTLALAARWQSARYGLPAPEVLYCADESGGDAVLRWEDGRLAIAKSYPGLLNWALGDFSFTEPEDGGALLVPDMDDVHHTMYFWTERTDAARAEAVLHLRTEADIGLADPDGSGEAAYYDWDVTYEMETVPDQNGLCRLEVPLRYDLDDFRLPAEAERSALREFSWVVRTGGGAGRAAALTVSLYDAGGALLDTWEKELYNDLGEEIP